MQTELLRWPKARAQQVVPDPVGGATVLASAPQDHALLVKLDPAGKQLWEQRPTEKFIAPVLAPIASGGYFLLADDGIRRLDDRGASASPPVSVPHRLRLAHAAVDSTGALVAVGSAMDQVHIFKFTPELGKAWERRYERPGVDHSEAVAIGPDDRICAGGSTEVDPVDGPDSHSGESYSTDIWIRCYTAQGELLWSKRYNAQRFNPKTKRFEQDHFLSALLFAPDGKIVVHGHSSDSPTWIFEVDARGEVGWRIDLENVFNTVAALSDDGTLQVAGPIRRLEGRGNDWLWFGRLRPE